MRTGHIIVRRVHRVRTDFRVMPFALRMQCTGTDEADCIRRNRAEDPVWLSPDVETVYSAPYDGPSHYVVVMEDGY